MKPLCFDRLKSYYELGVQTGTRLLERFEAEPAFRFHLLAWAVFLIIVSGSVLTHSNPFRLLVPGLAYSFPRLDHRQDVHYYTLSRRDLSLVQMTEKMERTGRFDDDARRLAFIVRKPFPLVTGRLRTSADGFFFPSFDLAIQRFWVKGDDLFVDVDSTFLGRELNRYDRAAGSTSGEEQSRGVARMFQACLTLTLFENFPEIKRITYLPDGHRIDASYTELKRDDLETFLKKEERKKSEKGKGEKKTEKKVLSKADEAVFGFNQVYVR